MAKLYKAEKLKGWNVLNPKLIDGEVHAAQHFFLAEERGEAIHVGTLSFTDEADAPGIPRLDACLFDPRVNDGLLSFNAEIIDSGEHVA